MIQHHYTLEEIEWIDRTIKEKTHQETAELFEKEFGVPMTRTRLKGVCRIHGLRTGRNGRFEKGNEPANKGKRGVVYTSDKKHKNHSDTQFKKGNKPSNTIPIGTELDIDGYIYVKINDIPLAPKTVNWIQKHRLIWEQTHERKVPENHAVVFVDGNRRNFDPNNLLLIHRSALVCFNKTGRQNDDPEIIKSRLLLHEVDQKAKRKGRENESNQNSGTLGDC